MSEENKAGSQFKFNRMEFAGSLGDLGVLLPLGIGMILINELNPLGLFLGVGLFYICSGLYFRVTAPVEPMKVIGAYAIATGVSAAEIQAASALVALMLLVVGATGAITIVGKYIPRPVIRGVQLSTGILLVSQGVKLMLGKTQFQQVLNAAEPYLSLQTLGPVPIGIIIGIALAVLTLFLLDHKKMPAALVIVGVGLGLGIILGTHEGLSKCRLAVNIPEILPFGIPPAADFAIALFALALPQIPMTLGNAVIANADLSREYFGEDAKRVTYRSLCLSMAFANALAFFLGGMPMCHGAGGLASRYRFGARTAGSNMIIGTIFIVLAVSLGCGILSILYLLPMAALGVLLIFAGSQLALTIIDMKTRKDLFVPLMIVGITIASNLAVGFLTGIFLAYLLRSDRLSI